MKKEQAYRYMKRLIIEGKMDPNVSIKVNEIAEQLNMSRTPVHKALTQLANEGFYPLFLRWVYMLKDQIPMKY